MTPGNNLQLFPPVLPIANNRSIQPTASLAVYNDQAVPVNNTSITNNNNMEVPLNILRDKIRRNAREEMLKYKNKQESQQFQTASHLSNMTCASVHFRSPNTSLQVGQSLEDSVVNGHSTGTAKDLLLMVTRPPSNRIPVVSRKKSIATGAAYGSSNYSVPVTDNKRSKNKDNKTTSPIHSPIPYHNDNDTVLSESAFVFASNNDSPSSHSTEENFPSVMELTLAVTATTTPASSTAATTTTTPASSTTATTTTTPASSTTATSTSTPTTTTTTPA